MDRENQSQQRLGYLAVSELPEVGAVGGLLLVNLQGRPIEFHCTLPVLPSKTQQVLFGSTLVPFIYVDQIGRALLSQLKQRPQIVMVDQEILVGLSQIDNHVLFFSTDKKRETSEFGPSPSGVSTSSPRNEDSPKIATAGGIEVCGPGVTGGFFCRADEAQIGQKLLEEFAQNLPLNEPFERIRQAIEEAHSGPNVMAA